MEQNVGSLLRIMLLQIGFHLVVVERKVVHITAGAGRIIWQ